MAVSSFNRELSVSIAKVADQAQRYDGMAEIMKNVAKSVVKLTEDERILLSKAYEKKISSPRAFWQMLSSELEKEKSDLMGEYREKVEAEISDICTDILSILDQHLIPSCNIWDQSYAFYYKMKGDYYTYLAEFKSGSAKREAADKAFEAYDYSGVIPPIHPIPQEVDSYYSDLLDFFFLSNSYEESSMEILPDAMEGEEDESLIYTQLLLSD